MRHAAQRVVGVVVVVCGLGLLGFGVATWVGALGLVVTNGNSMDPAYTSGDLVLVRPAERYDIGDVVAYRNSDLQQVVLHRVVDVDGGRLVTKGDNNTWVDSVQPEPSEIEGRAWVHVPGFGRHVQVLFDPAAVASVVGLASLVVLGGAPARSPDDLGAVPCVDAGC